jgi:hypothetical protein
LMRLMALGVDAARIVLASVSSLDPNSDEAILALRDPREGRGDGSEPQFKAIERFEGAIGDLELRKGQYVRKPVIGEFRGRVPSLVGQ